MSEAVRDAAGGGDRRGDRVAAGGRAQQGQATSGGSAYEVPLVGTRATPASPRSTRDPSPTTDRVDARRRRGQTVDIGERRHGARADLQRDDPGADVQPERRRHGDRPLREPPPSRPASTGTASSSTNSADGTPFTQNQVAAGRHVPLQVQGHPARDLLVPPAPPLVHEPGFKGLYGMIIVNDPNEAALQADGAAARRRRRCRSSSAT